MGEASRCVLILYQERYISCRPYPGVTEGALSVTSRPVWTQVVPELLSHCQPGHHPTVWNHWGLEWSCTALTDALLGWSREAWVQGAFPTAHPVGPLCPDCRVEADQTTLCHQRHHHSKPGACPWLLSKGKTSRKFQLSLSYLPYKGSPISQTTLPSGKSNDFL